MDFLKANAGKLAIVAVLLLVAIVLLAFQGGGAPSRSGEVQFVCVATGEIFWLDRQPRIFPFENPDTGEKTMLPCHEGEDGNIYVSSRCRKLVKEFEQNAVNKYVDPETLQVRTEP